MPYGMFVLLNFMLLVCIFYLINLIFQIYIEIQYDEIIYRVHFKPFIDSLCLIGFLFVFLHLYIFFVVYKDFFIFAD